jgi:hypothetical protein
MRYFHSHLRQVLIISGILRWVLAGMPIAQVSVHPSRINRPSTDTAHTPSLDFSDVGRPRRHFCLIADQPPLTALVPVSSTGYTLAHFRNRRVIGFGSRTLYALLRGDSALGSIVQGCEGYHDGNGKLGLEDRMDSFQQLVEAEWLGDVVFSSEFETAMTIAIVCPRC